MATVEDDLAALSISTGENDVLEIDQPDFESQEEYDHCFVGSFLTSSVINFMSMRSTLANVWHPVGGISISEMGEGRILFRLYNEVDANRFDLGGPWNFNKHLLILHKLQHGEDPKTVPLNHLCFWILISDVPRGFMSERVARSLGNFIGSFIEYDTSC
ncbi:hypothetical protein F3Y22_tig00110105pilonHSYRG00012 [Hibiscus syriacus]|uniref:DUF4283 domain-containing protein n=1 Tax=Hibiscus syriacus TaxID=106335 RepID=A0A6A3BKU2_HIBSY|nr:hypothetical protein F3Y22_tig00110105pilonHSYRG00012 [Hibiscus syriacus]